MNWKNQSSKAPKRGSPGRATFLDDVIEASRKKGPGKVHSSLPNWAQEHASTALQGHPHKDEFLKAPRRTIPDEVFAEQKRRHVPAPGTYDAEKPHKILSIPKSTTSKGALGDDAAYHSL